MPPWLMDSRAASRSAPPGSLGSSSPYSGPRRRLPSSSSPALLLPGLGLARRATSLLALPFSSSCEWYSIRSHSDSSAFVDYGVFSLLGPALNVTNLDVETLVLGITDM